MNWRRASSLVVRYGLVFVIALVLGRCTGGCRKLEPADDDLVSFVRFSGDSFTSDADRVAVEALRAEWSARPVSELEGRPEEDLRESLRTVDGLILRNPRLLQLYEVRLCILECLGDPDRAAAADRRIVESATRGVRFREDIERASWNWGSSELYRHHSDHLRRLTSGERR